MLRRVWNARLTWRAGLQATAVLCVAILVTAGIGGAAGAIALLALVAAWLLLFSRMSDNEARHVLAVASASGRTIPLRRVRRLLLPWWVRAALGVAALGATLAAIVAFDSDGLSALVFALAFGSAWLAERAVIAVRARNR
ncbi:MAG TPA: hypothetical protein VM049_03250 [Gaiellaceae bacterium]|nr:hypothetical protein [Gaiellaceae bacterium]